MDASWNYDGWVNAEISDLFIEVSFFDIGNSAHQFALVQSLVAATDSASASAANSHIQESYSVFDKLQVLQTAEVAVDFNFTAPGSFVLCKEQARACLAWKVRMDWRWVSLLIAHCLRFRYAGLVAFWWVWPECWIQPDCSTSLC